MERSDPSCWSPTAGEERHPHGVDAAVDAAEDARRASADEAAADEARARFRTRGVAPLPPLERIAPLLAPGEFLVAAPRAALLDRREPSPGTRVRVGLAGELYVTSQRLVLVGRLVLSFGLDAIEEAVISAQRLLIVLHGGQGLMIQVAQPRLLWAEIAAARALASDSIAVPAAGS